MLRSRCVGYGYTFCEVFLVGTDIAMGWLGFGSEFSGSWSRFGFLVFQGCGEMGQGPRKKTYDLISSSLIDTPRRLDVLVDTGSIFGHVQATVDFFLR